MNKSMTRYSRRRGSYPTGLKLSRARWNPVRRKQTKRVLHLRKVQLKRNLKLLRRIRKASRVLKVKMETAMKHSKFVFQRIKELLSQ